ncbi:putative ubiquitin-conjugating enzyme E2 38 [Bidens hawaiensis]|uniref:putative ubiquitin-conjugating enzyme E2 38 n=1 Tax=Bidens hawaiensis TaxID=980011 RepID=UPI004048FED4
MYESELPSLPASTSAESRIACMDPKIDGRTTNLVARSEEKEAIFDEISPADGVKRVVLVDDDKDEDLNEAADKMFKAVMAYISRPAAMKFRSVIKKPLLDTQRSTWSSCTPFLPFSEEYSSKFYNFIQNLSGLGIRSLGCNDTVRARLLQEGLPDTIFVRAYELRMDLLTAVIIGAKGTPYHDGLFFFDVYYPREFPLRPPVVRYRSGGFGINPHLFACGEFCSYRTWTLWSLLNPSVLQLLISIQNQVLNTEPLFHQHGFLDSGPSVVAKYFSLLYNEDTLVKSLKTMIYIMTKLPKNFEAFVVGHFRDRARDILEACKAYRDGLQARCVGRKEESHCSVKFRNDVNDGISQLVYHLKKIGATEDSKFSDLLSAPTPVSLLHGYMSPDY